MSFGDADEGFDSHRDCVTDCLSLGTEPSRVVRMRTIAVRAHRTIEVRSLKRQKVPSRPLPQQFAPNARRATPTELGRWLCIVSLSPSVDLRLHSALCAGRDGRLDLFACLCSRQSVVMMLMSCSRRLVACGYPLAINLHPTRCSLHPDKAGLSSNAHDCRRCSCLRRRRRLHCL